MTGQEQRVEPDLDMKTNFDRVEEFEGTGVGLSIQLGATFCLTVGEVAHGFNSYVVKPMDFDPFSESVRQLCEYWKRLNPTPKA